MPGGGMPGGGMPGGGMPGGGMPGGNPGGIMPCGGKPCGGMPYIAAHSTPRARGPGRASCGVTEAVAVCTHKFG